MTNWSADASLGVSAQGLEVGLPYTTPFLLGIGLNSAEKSAGGVLWSASASLDVTATLSVDATRNQSIDASLAITATATSSSTRSFFASSSLSATADPSSTDTRNANVNSSQAITVPGMEQSTVTFDAVGAGANSGAGTTTSLSWSHTATAGADVFVFVARGGSFTTVTYDGAAMSFIGAISLNNADSNGSIFVYRKAAVAGGTKTVAVTLASATYCSATSVSYLNVGSIKLSGSYAAAALTASHTVSGADKSVVICAQSQYCGGVDTFVSSSGGTQRYQGMGSAKYMNLVVQDSTSTGSITFTSTVTATNTVSGSIGLVLEPAPATTAKVKTVELLSTAYASTGLAYSLTWNHTIEDNATILVVAAEWLSQSWNANCTVNGQAMTRVGGTAYANSGWVGVVEFFYYVNPPTGTQTIVYNGGGTGAYLDTVSFTFANAKSVGTCTQSANAPLSVSGGGPNDFILNVLGGWQSSGGGFTGYNQNILYAATQPHNHMPSLFGYARGSSATFSVASLIGNYGGYGLAALPIKSLTDHVADANLAVTATITSGASRGQPLDCTIAVTSTITAAGWTNLVVGGALATTATITSTSTRNAIVAATQAITATLNGIFGRVVNIDSSLASTATATDVANFTPATIDAPQGITATLASSSTHTATVDASLAITGTVTSANKTNQVITGSQSFTATIDSTATRNAVVNASLAVTATLTDTATKNFNTNASLVSTATLTSAVTFSASGDTSLTASATISDLANRGALADVSQTITATPTQSFSRGQKLDAAQVITATGTAIESEAATGATPLVVSVALTAGMTRNQFCDSATEVISTSTSATATRNANVDGSLAVWFASPFPYTFPFFMGVPYVEMTMVKGILAGIDVITVDPSATVQRNVGEGSDLSVSSGGTGNVFWSALANILPLVVTATPTAATTKNLFIDAHLGITSSAIVLTSRDQILGASLAVSSAVSSGVKADFLLDADRPTTLSLTGKTSRGQNLDGPLEVTATANAVLRWRLKAQSSLSVTVTPDVTGIRNAKVNAALGITSTSDQYMFQTEQFDVFQVITAGLEAHVNHSQLMDAPLDITVLVPVQGKRVSFADASLDVAADIPIEGTRNVFGESRLEVWNAQEGAVNWDALFASTLEILAELPSLINQGFLVEANLSALAESTPEMLIEALLDALLTAETMTIDAYGIRDQYAEALQEISFIVTEETQWNIKMEAILIIPASIFANSRSGQVSSNFFVFYL